MKKLKLQKTSASFTTKGSLKVEKETIKKKNGHTNGNGTSVYTNGHTNGQSSPKIKFAINMPGNITKRDGRSESFDDKKIFKAINNCFKGLEKEPETPLEELVNRVVNIVSAKYKEPTVEQVQDIVEMVLQAAGEFEAAKSYILYRAEHAKLREERPIPKSVKKAFTLSDK